MEGTTRVQPQSPVCRTTVAVILPWLRLVDYWRPKALFWNGSWVEDLGYTTIPKSPCDDLPGLFCLVGGFYRWPYIGLKKLCRKLRPWAHAWHRFSTLSGIFSPDLWVTRKAS